MRLVLRLAMTGLQQLRRAWWFVARPDTRGVQAAAFTEAGRLVLVRLRYARGWRLPGGGVETGESAEAAVLRELDEEIGLAGWASLRPLGDFEHRPDFRRGLTTLFRLDGIRYAPKRSLEIEAVAEFDPNDLPDAATPLTRRLVAQALAGAPSP
jgi:8-oxo-dGTP pyrophosphatase MutT (NUDIX family)